MRKEDWGWIKGMLSAFVFLLLVIASIVMIRESLLEVKVERPPAKSMLKESLEKQKLTKDQKNDMVVRQALIDYYKKSGSRSPVDMMYAIMQTKRPKLMAAISVIESNGNYTVRNGGYKNEHHGAWQVNPRWWGKVPNQADLQAKQAEFILDIYLYQTGGDLIKALNKYGGCSQGKYATSIMNEMKNVPNVL